jgi:ubiquinone/menaquinone biosynthesis C-methylase UbiE
MKPSSKADDSSRNQRVRASYDTIAGEYAQHIYSELENKPFDRQWLNRFADLMHGQGMVVDLGCGPGQISRYLADRGISVLGLDLSHGMLLEAQRLNSSAALVEADMLAFPIASNQLGGITAFYSIIHLSRDLAADAFAEMHRVLRPNGYMLVAFHLGTDVLHTSELWGHQIDLDATFFSSEEVSRGLVRAGFKIEEVQERDPYHPDVEYQSRRGYILATKPG